MIKNNFYSTVFNGCVGSFNPWYPDGWLGSSFYRLYLGHRHKMLIMGRDIG